MTVRPTPRLDVDVEIDRLWHCMVHAETPESRLLWGRRFTEAVNARNATRSAEEIAELERQRGLSA